MKNYDPFCKIQMHHLHLFTAFLRVFGGRGGVGGVFLLVLFCIFFVLFLFFLAGKGVNGDECKHI